MDPLAKRAALFLFILFQISLARAQTTGDSSRLADSLNGKPVATHTGPVIQDTVLNKPVHRKQVKATVDTVGVYHTDSLRFSAIKPEDLSHLPVTRADLLKTQSFFNFTGKAVHIPALR
ncbi:MAG TPA: hypothetical protein DIC22_05980, partial [Chitinophagaceae bacterium]|nr:hypothetical protein [Chitinophagaceae bacterium]